MFEQDIHNRTWHWILIMSGIWMAAVKSQNYNILKITALLTGEKNIHKVSETNYTLQDIKLATVAITAEVGRVPE